jgi:hypothetical protein
MARPVIFLAGYFLLLDYFDYISGLRLRPQPGSLI